MHYRVTHETNRPVGRDELLLVDSGAQFTDGTTDITRTVGIGDPGDEATAKVVVAARPNSTRGLSTS